MVNFCNIHLCILSVESLWEVKTARVMDRLLNAIYALALSQKVWVVYCIVFLMF